MHLSELKIWNFRKYGIKTIDDKEKPSFEKSLHYMGLEPGSDIKGKKVDYVFIGSCTNSRI